VTLTPTDAALIAEVCSRSDLVWLRPPGSARWRAAWHVWHDDAVCIVSGGGEQDLPVLGDEVHVIGRSKETGARLVTFVASVETLSAGTEVWDHAAFALVAGRLNAREPQAQKQRWAEGGVVRLLRPVRLLTAGAGEDDAAAERAQVPRGPGTTLGKQPFHVGGRRRRAARRLGARRDG
jgi:hypothetical protein